MASRALILALLLAALIGCAKSGEAEAPSRPSSGPPKAERAESRATGPAAKRECSALVDSINPVLVEIQRVSARRGSSERESRRDLSELGRLYEKLHGRVRGVTLETPELRGFAGEYLAMILEVQKTMTEIIDALDERDVPRAERGQEDFAKIVAVEDDLVDRINRFCE